MTIAATVTAALPVMRDRVEVLDAVRGAALLGILVINIDVLTGYTFVPRDARALLPGARWDSAVALLLAVLVEGKFYALFSLLFGIGFAVFVARAQARGVDAVRLFRRRLTGLLLIGLAHALLIWFGDILVTYAILGFGLIPFLRRPDRTLLRWAAAMLLLPVAIYAIAGAVVAIVGLPPGAPPNGDLPPIMAQAANDLAHGSYLEVIRANVIFTVGNVVRRTMLMFFPRVFGMFLLGLYIGRSGMLTDLRVYRPLLRRVAAWGGVIGLPLAIAGVLLPDRFGLAGAIAVEGIAKSLAIPALTLSYAASLSLLFDAVPALRDAFAAPGRMALSNYLMHSIAGIVVFYGIGLGFLGRLSLTGSLLVGLAAFVAQIAISRAWLSRAAFGPAEWLWRMFTYRRSFPLLKAGA